MGGRTMTMGSKTKVKEKRGGRKKCPEGTKCPYKHEYQHDLEYTHEDDLEANEKSKKARTKSPVGAGVFSGGGQRLGESTSLRNSFLPNSNSASTVSSSNDSSNPKKTKNRIPRAVIATAASAREANAPSVSSNNGAGGCGRDGSGIFIRQTLSSENKALPKIALNLNQGPSTASSYLHNKSALDAPSRLKDDGTIEFHNDIDSFNSGRSYAAQSNRNGTKSSCPNDEKTRKRMEVIHLDSDDEEDEIVFLGKTDNNSNNTSTNNRSNYSSGNNHYHSTGASVSSNSGSNSGSSISIYKSDDYSGRRESYPEIINKKSRGQDSSNNNAHNRGNYSSDSNYFYSTGASLPSSSSSHVDYNTGRRESYPEIISVNSRGHANRGKDPISRSHSNSSTAPDLLNTVYFDGYDTGNTFNNNSSGIYHSSDSNLTSNKSSSSSSPVLADEMLKVVCEICSKRIHINSLDYHLRRHELAGDDVKHKQDKEYEKSVEEELLKRTEKEAELRETERAKLKAQEDAELSEIVKQSIELEAEVETEYFRKNLEPEPGITERSIRLRFCLPMPAEKGSAPVKLVRRFNADRSFQDAISFLKAQEALSGLKWTVRMSTGTEQFRATERQSFSELGILTDTSFLVVLHESS